MIRRFLATIAFIAVGLFVTLGYSAVFPENNSVTAQTNQMAPASSTKLNAIDKQFIIDAGQAGVGNTNLSQLALQRSNDPQVKQFAQAEIQEQTQLKNDLARIAPKLGVTPPKAPAAKHETALARLSQLSGENFNQAYMDEGGVNAHLENAAVFQREAAFGQNPDLVAVANKGLPIIQKHFTTASTVTDYKFGQVARNYNNQSNTSSGASLPQSSPAPAMAQ